MNPRLQDLLNNLWIEKYEGPWRSSNVLAVKPHQGHIQNIDDFIWRICISYRELNGITKTFELPIPCFDDVKSTVSTGSNKLWIISLDARQVYQRISVRHVNREKLAFFAPDNQNIYLPHNVIWAH